MTIICPHSSDGTDLCLLFRSTRKLGQHKGAAHKLALLNGRPHEFISGGEDGLIMGLDVRQSTPDKLLVQVISSFLVTKGKGR